MTGSASGAVVVEGLSFRYPGRKRPALREVSFAVEPGETLLVLGPSGGGKSTLALCLNGLIPHSVPGEQSGTVRVGGLVVSETPVAELATRVGLVFQDPDAQFCMLRVDDEVAFGLENLGVPRAEMPSRIARALDLVGLRGRERWRIDRLSGGMRQRLALACVLAMDPAILVLDEPTSNLDPAGAEEVFADLARLKARGDRTLIVVEHRLDHLIQLVDRVLVLGTEGAVVAHGAPARVLRDHADELDALGIWIPQVSEVANRLTRAGYHLDPYPTTVDLAEEAFGRLVGERRAGNPGSVDPGASAEPARRGETPAVEIAHLSFRYPSGFLALDDVSLSVADGDFVAIVGPNGAGKSTLASHLIGTLRPAPGSVRLFGRDARDIPSPDLAHLVGYVFQNPEHQFVAGTVYDELAYGLRVRGWAETRVKERVDDVLADFGLDGLARANPFTLSHGEKRRLSVATILILEPRILVLDEPTFGQDRRNTDALTSRLAALNEAGRTVVLITHDVRLIAEYARRVVVLVDGRVVFAGSVDELFADPELMRRSRLVAPPVLELSRRLAARDPAFPEVATASGFVAELCRRFVPPVGTNGAIVGDLASRVVDASR